MISRRRRFSLTDDLYQTHKHTHTTVSNKLLEKSLESRKKNSQNSKRENRKFDNHKT